jgi:hypothetical protein
VAKLDLLIHEVVEEQARGLSNAVPLLGMEVGLEGML